MRYVSFPQGAIKRPLPERNTPWSRRLFQFGLLFLASILVTNALFGKRGLLGSIEARHRHSQLAYELLHLRHENTRLRVEIRQLREDPEMIEVVARQELGLIRPGEILLLFGTDQRSTDDLDSQSTSSTLKITHGKKSGNR